MITSDERKRLIQLLGMLGSDHDGEVLNAARLARKLVLDHKCTFEEIFSPTGRATNPGSGRNGEGGKVFSQKDLDEAYLRGFKEGVKLARSGNRGWRQWAKDRVDNDADLISDWELRFFGDFATGKFARPTAKQRAIFERVADRLGIELPEPTPEQAECPF